MISKSKIKFTALILVLILATASTTAFEGGDGTSSSPYEIATCSQLQDMESDTSAHYELIEDVDCSDTEGWNGGDGFNPVGTFTGSLEGNNYEIEGLFIDRPNRHVGLFDITDSADIRNLGVVDAEVIGERRVAHIVGNTDGSTLIENVYSEGTVRGLGDGSWAQAGAIVGRMESNSIVRNAYSNTDLEAVDDSAHGSLIGFMRDDSQIENVYALGEVVDMDTESPDRIGGLIGDFYDEQPEVRKAYSSALVDASGSTVGGFLGNDDSSASPSVADSYWDIDTSGQTSSAGNPEGLSTNEMRGEESVGNMDFDFEESWVYIEEDEEIIAQDASNRIQRITPQKDGYPVLNNSKISKQLEYQDIEYEVEPFLEDAEIVALEETGAHTWEVPEDVEEVDVLVVGGGGGGGAGQEVGSSDHGGGGGGAGELIFEENYDVSQDEEIDINVGSGGSGAPGADTSGPGGDGEKSFFGPLEAKGGGGGASRDDGRMQGQDGGSGGGGTYDETQGGISTAEQGQGHPGGIGSDGGSRTIVDSGGGGGAGEPGQDAQDPSSSCPGTYEQGDGQGGDGVYYGDIYGETFGEKGWFAGGGGGGHGTCADTDEIELIEGGAGGGGHGGIWYQTETKDRGDGEDGKPNTGAGGGGGPSNNDRSPLSSIEAKDGGDGGSGVVLVRYRSDISICDRRGPFEECVSDSTHSISGQEFILENIFEAESTAVFQALSEKASISVSNSTSISGVWEGSFNVSSGEGESTRLGAGAEFRPEGGRITIN